MMLDKNPDCCSVHQLSCTAACSDILRALNEPHNAEKLARARESAGSDMVKVMREVFPIVTQVQMEVIQQYGFDADGDGELRCS